MGWAWVVSCVCLKLAPVTETVKQLWLRGCVAVCVCVVSSSSRLALGGPYQSYESGRRASPNPQVLLKELPKCLSTENHVQVGTS